MLLLLLGMVCAVAQPDEVLMQEQVEEWYLGVFQMGKLLFL